MSEFAIKEKEKEKEEDVSKMKGNYKKKKRKVIIGYIFLVIVIFIAVLSSIIIKDIFREYPKPFAFTYFDTLFLVVLIPTYHIKEYIKKKLAERKAKNPPETRGFDGERNDYKTIEDTNNESEHNKALNKLFHPYAVLLMMFWYLGNVFYNYGLSTTSITSANTLSNTSIVFIFLLEVFFFKAACDPFKIVATIIAGIGIFFMGKFESTLKRELQNDSLLGDILVLLGALFYSLYSVILKQFSKMFGDSFDMMKMFGYVGLYDMIFIPFLLLFAHISGIEAFSIPSSKLFFEIFINSLISCIISDLLQSYAITYLSPLQVQFGLTLGIPLSFVYDMLNGNISFNYLYVIGSGLIVLSLLIMLFQKFRKMKMKEDLIKKNESQYKNLYNEP